MSHHFIKFSDVRFRYPGADDDTLKGVNLLVRHGERVALLGQNGSGKSTLLLHTNGLLLPSSGEVNVGGVPLTKKTAPEIRRVVGMVFQNADDQLFMPTVSEDVAFGPHNMSLPEEEVQRRVKDSLEAVGALPLINRSASELSGGQRRAVAIATVLAMEPSIIILDEPTANLDRATRRRLINILEGFSHTIIIATHDIELALEFCPRTLFMADGKIIADGETREILSDTPLMQQQQMDINPTLLRVHPTKNVKREATYSGADFVLQTKERSELRD